MNRQDATITVVVVSLFGSACGPVVTAADSDGSSTGSSSTASTTTTTTTMMTTVTASTTTSTPGDVGTSASDEGFEEGLKTDHNWPDVPVGPDVRPECAAFDPDRVYLHGTLEEGAAFAEALADPLDPNEFCVGFTLSTDVGIRPDGRVVLVDGYEGNSIREFEPDPIAIDRAGGWDYPLDPYANDPVLVPDACDDSSTPFEVVMSPLGDVFYSCPPQWFAPGGVLLPLDPSSPPIAITATGDALVFDEVTRLLYVVAPGDDALGAPYGLPRDVSSVHTGRVFAGGMWMVAIDWDNVTAYRWRLGDGIVLEDGIYSAIDASATGTLLGGALDAEGDYWHTAHDVDTVDMIIQRRLEPEDSVIVYREDQEPEPAVKIHGSRLFTGP